MERENIPLGELQLPAFGAWEPGWWLLTAGENRPGEFNSMTVSWGAFGVIWHRPLVIVVVFALTITFMSFGLHAPPNGTVVATLFLAAVSISGVLYLILEMYLPFGGFISVPSTPLVAALGYLGR